jgi:predicted aspartyl protease
LLDIAININGKFKNFEAIVDTGFDGLLSVNEELAKLLGLIPAKRGITINVDNQRTINNIYEINIIIGGLDLDYAEFKILALGKEKQTDEIIIGQTLLSYFSKKNKLNLVFNYEKEEIFFESN